MKSQLRQTWDLLKPHLRPRVPALVAVAVLGSITTALQSTIILLFDPIVNVVLFPGGPGAEQSTGESSNAFKAWMLARFDDLTRWATRAGAFDNPQVAALVGVTVLGLVLAVVAGASQYGFTLLSRLVAFQLIVDLRVRVARHLMALSVRYHSQRRFGDLLSRVSSDVTTTLAAVNTSLKTLLIEPMFAVAMVGVAFVQAPIPTIGLALVIPIAAIPITKLTAKVRRGSRKSLSTLGVSVQTLTQMFQGIRTVKSYGREEAEIERYREINDSYLKASMRMVRSIAMAHTWTAFYSVAGVAVLVLVLGILTIRFGLFANAGQMMVFFVAIAMLNNHVKNFTRALTKVEESVGASQRIQALLDEPAEVAESPDPVRIRTFENEIRFEGVGLRYPGADEDAVRDLDLTLHKGETLALVGPSGAGKSTVVDLVARFIDPTAGRIVVDGVDLARLSVRDWTEQYALVGQVPFLFHAPIGENIRYGRPDATDDEVERAARAAGIHDFIASLPEGYDTDVSDMGSRLSGGQRQRITIARALLREAPLLLLDEATSALDSESEAEVQAALERLMKDRTVLVIAHRLSTIRGADRIAVLDRGRLVELGSHDELLARGETYARLYELQNLEPRDRDVRPSPVPRG